MIVLCFFIGYYLVYCLSCGKANMGQLKGHQLSRCSLYSGLTFAMLGNLGFPLPHWPSYPSQWCLGIRPSICFIDQPLSPGFSLPLSLSSNRSLSPLRPNIAQANGPISASPLDIENFLVNEVLCCCCNCCGCRHGHCACCGQPSEAMLLPYKLAQISLFTIGCCSGCGLYQWVGGEPLQHRIGTEMALLTSPHPLSHPLSLSVSRASIARN
jgi:hypothetical protein